MPYKKRKRSAKKSSRFSKKFKRYFRKYARKSRSGWRKRTRRGNKYSGRITSINLRPVKLKVQLRYRYILNSTSLTGGVVTRWQYGGNNPYDPDYATGGNTANMFGTLSSWYNSYMCTYSKIRFKWQLQTIGNYQMQYWFGVRSTLQSAPSNYLEAGAQPRYSLGQKQLLTTTSSNEIGPFKLKGSTPQQLGRKMDPSIDRVLINTNPNELWLYDFTLLSSSAATVNAMAWITYWVEFSDPEAVPYT